MNVKIRLAATLAASSIKDMERYREDVLRHISAILDEVGTITFTEDTGFPMFRAHGSADACNIIAVRSEWDDSDNRLYSTRSRIAINTTPNGDGRPSSGCWFRPEMKGDFDINELYEYIMMWIQYWEDDECR